MTYRTDYHIHSWFSDGKAAPEDYIAPAVAAGLNEIGFSEHLVLFSEPLDWSMNISDVQGYLTHIKNLKENTRDIIIRTGLEVDFFAGKAEEIQSYLNKMELDYVIGSVHYLGDESVDKAPEFYEEKNLDKLFESYFDLVSEAAASGLFDMMAHCDLVRIYGFKPSFDPSSLYRKLAINLKTHNVAFELNTNGRNRPLGDFYPDRRFLHIFREENVPVCINSDAHMPSRVGQYFDEAYQLLRDTGYTEMAVFEKRKRHMVPL